MAGKAQIGTHFVKSFTLSRMPGRACSQRPIMVSDSPPWLPSAQRGVNIRRVDSIEAVVYKRIKNGKTGFSSMVQPKRYRQTPAGDGKSGFAQGTGIMPFTFYLPVILRCLCR